MPELTSRNTIEFHTMQLFSFLKDFYIYILMEHWSVVFCVGYMSGSGLRVEGLGLADVAS